MRNCPICNSIIDTTAPHQGQVYCNDCKTIPFLKREKILAKENDIWVDPDQKEKFDLYVKRMKEISGVR